MFENNYYYANTKLFQYCYHSVCCFSLLNELPVWIPGCQDQGRGKIQPGFALVFVFVFVIVRIRDGGRSKLDLHLSLSLSLSLPGSGTGEDPGCICNCLWKLILFRVWQRRKKRINFQTKTKNQFLYEQKLAFPLANKLSIRLCLIPISKGSYLDVFFAEKLGFVLFPLDDFAPAVKT